MHKYVHGPLKSCIAILNINRIKIWDIFLTFTQNTYKNTAASHVILSARCLQ
jgi:hypothetical protein